MKTLSKEVINEVKQLLPELREQVIKEFVRLNLKPTKDFYSDEKFLKELPYTTYEYIILAWSVEPARIDYNDLIYALKTKLFRSLPTIVAHGLRKMRE